VQDQDFGKKNTKREATMTDGKHSIFTPRHTLTWPFQGLFRGWLSAAHCQHAWARMVAQDPLPSRKPHYAATVARPPHRPPKEARQQRRIGDVGHTGGDVVRDGDFIRVPMLLMDQSARSAG
jgi:hypothetical protein